MFAALAGEHGSTPEEQFKAEAFQVFGIDPDTLVPWTDPEGN
jgi:hypothetical protein